MSQYPSRSGTRSRVRARAEQGVVATSDKLEDRVEGHDCYARPAIKLKGSDALHDGVDDGAGPVVTVVDRIAEQCPIGVEQAVVDPPGVDPDRVQASHATCGADTVENSTIKAEHIPMDMAAGPDGSVPEPVDLSELEMFLTELGDEHTSARGAEIDSDDACRPRGRYGLCSNDCRGLCHRREFLSGNPVP